MTEIEELIEAEKREALEYFESRPLAAGQAVRRPVIRWRWSWTATATGAAATLAVLAAWLARPPAFQPRVEVVEAALRRATVPVTPTPSGGPQSALAWTVEAALWRGRGPTDPVEVERIVAAALGGPPAADRTEPRRTIDALDLQRRIERLGARSLERLLRNRARPAS